MATRLLPTLRDLLVGEAEPVDQLAIGRRFLDRVEILALEVLDQRELQLLPPADSRTTAGMCVRPASRAARSRRSPAISS